MYIGRNENENCWEFVDVNLNDIRYFFLEEKDSPCNFYKQDMFIALNLDADDANMLESEGITIKKRLIADRKEFSLQGVKLIIPPKRPTSFSIADIFERKEIPFEFFREKCLALRLYAADEEQPYCAMNIKAKVYKSCLYITQILVIVDPMGLFSFVKED